MTGKIAVSVLCFVWFGAQAGTGSLAAANGDRVSHLAQKAADPPTADRPAPEAAPALSEDKMREAPGKEKTPATPPKKEPPKAFDPTEKVKADQAIDFPADI